jgi:hypothetical protein
MVPSSLSYLELVLFYFFIILCGFSIAILTPAKLLPPGGVDGANNDSACVVLDLSLTLTRHPCLCSVVVGTCSPEAP